MESYRLARLRFLRPPPAFVEPTPTGKEVKISFEVLVVVQDDYGITIDSVGELALALSVVDSETHIPLSNPALSYTPSTINTSSAFHPIKLTLTFHRPQISKFKFLLSAQAIDVPPSITLSEEAAGLQEFVGERGQSTGTDWDGEAYLFLRVLSGDVGVRSVASVSGPGKGKGKLVGGGKKEDGISVEKVQTAIRRTYLSKPTGEDTIIETIETAGLNNSTGQRLWDAAIALSYYFFLHPHLLILTPHLLSTPNDEESTTKRPRLDNRPRKILELGGGLALVSLVASSLLSNMDANVEVVCTDVAVTVETTLRENLEANSLIEVRAAVLDWGPTTEEKMREVLGLNEGAGGMDLTIVASDVLYHPESHRLLLETMLGLFGFTKRSNDGREGRCQAFIAYKPRTEGDDGFFELAREAGLTVQMVWRFGTIQVYRFSVVVVVL